MHPTDAPAPAAGGTPGAPGAGGLQEFGDVVPLARVERELEQRQKASQAVYDRGEGPVVRSRMSNLVIFTDSMAQARAVSAEIPRVVALHPARVLLLIGEPPGTGPGTADPARPVEAAVGIRGRLADPGRWYMTEQITLHGRGGGVEHLPFLVRSLVIGDLPVNVWWAATQPPPQGGALMYDLVEYAQQVIYDSNGWADPARGVAATAVWLAQIDRVTGVSRWRVAADLNWRRLKYWRRLIAQALDPVTAPGALSAVREVLIEHGPHAVVQGWELASWLAACLGWTVRVGKVDPGVELSWLFAAPHGGVTVRIRRLADGPSDLRRVWLGCRIAGQDCGLNVSIEGDRRLRVVPEGTDASPTPGAAARTLTTPAHDVPDLLGRQLSDREHDPVFRDSMAVAQRLAMSLLH